MATVRHQFNAQAAVLPASGGAQLDVISGTNFPVLVIAFDAAAEEAVYFPFRASAYGSGNLTLNIEWYSSAQTTGDVIWGAALAAVTPETDTQNIETKAFATANEVTDSHLGTTAQRIHRAAITISNLDGLAADDDVVLKLYRKAAAGGDTMTGDALVIGAELNYSDA